MGFTHTEVHGTLDWGGRGLGCRRPAALPSLCQEAIYVKMPLESLDKKPGMVQVLSNEGTDEDPGCVSIWQ